MAKKQKNKITKDELEKAYKHLGYKDYYNEITKRYGEFSPAQTEQFRLKVEQEIDNYEIKYIETERDGQFYLVPTGEVVDKNKQIDAFKDLTNIKNYARIENGQVIAINSITNDIAQKGEYINVSTAPETIGDAVDQIRTTQSNVSDLQQAIKNAETVPASSSNDDSKKEVKTETKKETTKTEKKESS